MSSGVETAVTLLAADGWYRALTLAERAAFPGPVDSDLMVAARLASTWRRQPPFERPDVFARMLETSGLDEERFVSLLGEPAAALRRRVGGSLPWLERLGSAFTSTPVTGDGMPLDAAAAESDVDFLGLLRPLLDQAHHELRSGASELARAHPPAGLDAAAVAALAVGDLPLRCLRSIRPTLVLELNVARLEGTLSGSTPEERFRSFTDRLTRPDVALEILGRYPVLAREMVQRIDQWRDRWLELLRRFVADAPAIRETFSPDRDPGRPLAVEDHLGDRHRGGRMVIAVTFESGLKLAYKPRPLAVETHFQELLAWCNEHGTEPPFRYLRVLDRGHYGWVEWVTAEPCSTPAAVDRFYRRQGGLLALLHLLLATDCHAENLVAAGEQPVLVDLETLLHPPSPADAVRGRITRHTVRRIGLLPEIIWGNEESPGIDVSGLGTAGGQQAPRAVPSVVEGGTDRMRLVPEPFFLPAARNRPTLAGADVSLLDHADALTEGFAAVYRLLVERRRELLARDGPLASFARVEVRAVLRPTVVYTRLLAAGFHPDFLQDALARDRLFHRLWVGAAESPWLAPVVAAELEDLGRGDVPRFTCRPDATALARADSRPLPGYFPTAPFEWMRRELSGWGDGDLDLQTWIIEASLEALRAPEAAPSARHAPPREVPEPPTRDALLSAGRDVAERLAALALETGDELSWLHLESDRRGARRLEPVGIDLYGGLAGIALFFAHLGELTAEERWHELARRTWSGVERRCFAADPPLDAPGAFTGWGGVVWTLLHLSALWREPSFLDRAESLALDRVRPSIPRDESFDVLSGTAGALASLLALHAARPSDRLLQAALEAGDHLLTHGVRGSGGLGWIVPGVGPVPVAGFAHGTAGVAWALLELAAASGETRFASAAHEAFAYERRLFDPALADWRDVRRSSRAADGSPAHRCGWCHGAPGIALARLAHRERLDDEAIREIRAAVAVTLKKGFARTHGLCHGDLGNLDFLHQAAVALEDSELSARVRRLAGGVLKAAARGWHCGPRPGLEMPGLMVGLAGVGYGLLRLATPERVPSVLLLNAPAAAHSRSHGCRRGRSVAG